MLGLFGKVTPYIKPKRKVDVPRPDNFVFRLHYKVFKGHYFQLDCNRDFGY